MSVSDKDILKKKFGLMKHNKLKIKFQGERRTKSERKICEYGNIIRLLREVIWIGSWKTRELESWLDEFHPSIIFFVGGDSCFAYRICSYIKRRYNARLALYITDDYFMPRRYDSLVGKLRRVIIRKHFVECLKITDTFFTISESMSKAYKEEFGKDSIWVVNMIDPLRDNSIKNENEKTTLIYTGSIYYGRDKVLGRLSEAVEKYVENCNQKNIELIIFSNNSINNKRKKNIIHGKSTKLLKSVGKEELIKQLNSSDILVFVESFDNRQIEKTKYSLSTKIPEYLSLHKPILAVGPEEVGSMQYLKNVSMCVCDENQIYDKLKELLESEDLKFKLSDLAEEKYYLLNDKKKMKDRFLGEVFGLIE